MAAEPRVYHHSFHRLWRYEMAPATKAKPKIKIHPLEDRVVIFPADEAEAMRGGLYIPDTAKEKPTQGEVLAVGPGRLTDKGERIRSEERRVGKECRSRW